MKPTEYQLITLLADGQFHSGVELGEALGVSRASVSQRLKGLSAFGLDVLAVKGRGYRLAEPIELLDKNAILQRLPAPVRASFSVFEVFYETASTNQFLYEKMTVGASSGVCLAEFQRAGKGRRGRQWLGAFGHGITMSMSWRYSSGLSALHGLSLAVGVAFLELMQRYGVEGLSLKWPNDILIDGNKVAGILIEAGGDVSGDCFVVVGVGVNVAEDSTLAQLDRSTSNLQSHGLQLGRNRLQVELIQSLYDCLAVFSERGFSHYRQRWQAHAAYKDEQICVTQGQQVITGKFVGVNDEGHLILAVDGQHRMFSGGEVSVRCSADASAFNDKGARR